MAKPDSATEDHSFNTVLIYAVFASFWILLSDRALEWLVPDESLYLVLSTAKGWLFVAITSLLLWWLLRRRTAAKADTIRLRRPGFIYLALAMTVLVLAGAGFAQIYSSVQEREFMRLRTLAERKAGEIQDWLDHLGRDADFVQANASIAEKYKQFRAGDARAGGDLQRRMRQLLPPRGFDGICMFEPNGAQVFCDMPAPLPPTLLAAVRRVAASHASVRVGPYRDSTGGAHLDFVVPLKLDEPRVPVAVLHADPERSFFPRLIAWPDPGAGTRILLVRRAGGTGVILNETPGYPLGSAISLKNPQLMLAKVLDGQARDGELVLARDFRGRGVLAVGETVPGTDWRLVARIVRPVFVAEVLRDSAWVGLSALLALFIGAASLILARSRQRLAISEATREAQAERMGALQLLDSIATASDDAIFAKDLEGRYTVFNRAAGEVVGRSPEEVLGRDDRELFPPEQAERLRSIGQRVMTTREAETGEELFDTPAGRRVLLATNGPLYDTEGRVAGQFCISRDITRRKETELQLRESEARFRVLFDNAPTGMYVHDKDSGAILQANRHALAAFGYDTVEALAHKAFAEPPYGRGDAVAKIRQAVRSGPQRFEWQSRRADGSLFWQDIRLQLITLDGVERVLAIAQDITERKAVEAELRQRFDELERFNRAAVGRELDMIELKQKINALSEELGRPAPYALDFLNGAGPAEPQPES